MILSGKSTQKARSKEILDRFAPHHDQENHVNSISCLLGEFQKKMGPNFSNTKKNVRKCTDGKPFYGLRGE